jgi:flagellar hook-associated protein 3 FlgL
MISRSNTRFRASLEISRQQRLSKEVARAQSEISTMKRILAPSDDPVAAGRVAQIGKSQTNTATWLRNVESASALASRADVTLASVTNLLDRAKELMLTGSTGTSSAENREVIAIELRSIASELEQLADTKDFRGADLFSAGQPLAIPVAEGVSVAPVGSRAAVFGNVTTPGGTLSIADIVNAAADGLMEPDDALRPAANQASLAALDAGLAHISSARSEQGLRADRLDTIRERLEDSSLNMSEERVGLEGVDLPAAIARVQSHDIALKAAQAVYAQLNRSTLFDLLR